MVRVLEIILFTPCYENYVTEFFATATATIINGHDIHAQGQTGSTHIAQFVTFFYSISGLSVSVSTFTMLAISIERYCAICCPLQSRRWQTKSHACKVGLKLLNNN